MRFVNHITWWACMVAAVAIFAGWWQPDLTVVACVAFIAYASTHRIDLKLDDEARAKR